MPDCEGFVPDAAGAVPVLPTCGTADPVGLIGTGLVTDAVFDAAVLDPAVATVGRAVTCEAGEFEVDGVLRPNEKTWAVRVSLGVDARWRWARTAEIDPSSVVSGAVVPPGVR